MNVFGAGDKYLSAGDEQVENMHSLYLSSDPYCIYTDKTKVTLSATHTASYHRLPNRTKVEKMITSHSYLQKRVVSRYGYSKGIYAQWRSPLDERVF